MHAAGLSAAKAAGEVTNATLTDKVAAELSFNQRPLITGGDSHFETRKYNRPSTAHRIARPLALKVTARRR